MKVQFSVDFDDDYQTFETSHHPRRLFDPIRLEISEFSSRYGSSELRCMYMLEPH